MKIEYYSDVKDGKLQVGVMNSIKNQLPQFEGKRVKVSIVRFKGKRSYLQNNLWHSYIDLVANELGYEHEEFHEIAKFKFLQREKVDEDTGEIWQYVASTTELSKEEFSILVDNFARWCAERFGIVLPTPGEGEWQIIINKF